MKLRPNVTGEQNKSKLKFQQLRLFNQQSPRLGHCGEAYGARPGFFRASQQHRVPIGLRTEQQRSPSLQTKGVTGTLAILQNGHPANSQNDGLPASCSGHTGSEQQQVTPRLQTKGSKVCRQFTSRQKNIFLKRNNLFRIKQKQLNCERTFE